MSSTSRLAKSFTIEPEINDYVLNTKGKMCIRDRGTSSSPAVRVLRNAVLDIVGHVPFAQHAIAQQLSELDNR